VTNFHPLEKKFHCEKSDGFLYFQEAMSEEPNLGSPVAEYELEAEAEEARAESVRQAEEAMERRLQKYMPAPAPDRGILMSPNYRCASDCYESLSMMFTWLFARRRPTLL
jgi:hypothetical protein